MDEGGPISKSDSPPQGRDHSSVDAVEAPLLSPLRELQLVDAYRSGDPEAIGTLLRSYQRRMYNVCYRMLRDQDEARDLTQDSMIKVIEGLETFDARARLSTWVIRVTMNCCLSHLRKQKLRRHLSLDAAVAAGDEGPLPMPAHTQLANLRELSGPERVEQKETSEVVLSALDALDPHMRAVLVLRDMHDLDYQQIAEVIDKPVGTVKSRLFRARSALRDAIGALTSPPSPDVDTD